MGVWGEEISPSFARGLVEGREGKKMERSLQSMLSFGVFVALSNVSLQGGTPGDVVHLRGLGHVGLILNHLQEGTMYIPLAHHIQNSEACLDTH